MSTSITTEPISRKPIRLPAEVEYDLKPEDYVECWRFLARHSRHRLPQRVFDELKKAAFCLHFLVSIALVILAFGSEVARRGWPTKGDPGALVIALMIAAGLNLVLGAVLSDVRPELYLDGFLAKLSRGVCIFCLRALARSDTKKGRTELLDVLSHYRFAMNPEGLALTAEYRQRFGGSPVTLRKRRDEIAWGGVEIVGCTERHVFFVIPDLIPVILPRTCFADDGSFSEFAQTAIRYRDTRFIVHGSQAVMPGPEDRFGPRPI
jgi:hypothetical protein